MISHNSATQNVAEDAFGYRPGLVIDGPTLKTAGKGWKRRFKMTKKVNSGCRRTRSDLICGLPTRVQ